MAKFIMRRMADGMAEGRSAGKRYPHLLRLMTKDLDFVAQRAARNTTLSPQEIKSAISQAAEVIAELCAEGYSVSIDEVGTFRARISLREGAEEEKEGDTSQRTGASVVLSGYSFKPSRKFISMGNERASFERVSDRKWYRRTPLPEEERRAALMAYLAENTLINVADYCRLTGLGRTAAREELRRLAAGEHPLISRQGIRPHVVYIATHGD